MSLNPRRFLEDAGLPELTAEEAQLVVKRARITPELAARASSAPTGSRTFAGSGPGHGEIAEETGHFGPPSGGARETFARLDQNHDGKLDIEELPEGMRAVLAQADTSGDGTIDPEELATAMGNMRGDGHGPGSGAGG